MPRFSTCYAATLALASCGDGASTEAGEPAPSLCVSEACDDGDPCTDDGCDQDGTRCVFVPIDVLSACRTDAHCGDDDRCTDDRCEVSDCGTLRCVNARIPRCATCTTDADCVDVDPKTIDACRDGLCTFAADPYYDPLCDHRVPPPDDIVRGVVWLQAVDRCDACPCLLAPPRHASEGTPFTFEVPDASCTIMCDGSPATMQMITCAPLVFGASYLAWGAKVEAPVRVEGWCLRNPLYTSRPLHGTLRLGAHIHAVQLQRVESVYVLRCLDASCQPTFGVSEIATLRSQDEPPVMPLSFRTSAGTIVAKLLPNANGAAGRLEPLDLTDPPIEGELVLELENGPFWTGW